jgi:hypothetical protein
MTVLIDKYRLCYVSAPKVACTSVKTAMFGLENDRPFEPFHANGILRHIHDPALYPARAFTDLRTDAVRDYLRITLVRDPLRRFLSCYANRVVHYRELSASALPPGRLGPDLPPDPDLHTFIDLLDDYRAISPSIRLHTQPLHFFLGPQSGFYDCIFDISDIAAFDGVVARHCSRPFRSPHLQTGGPKLDPGDLTPDQTANLQQRYQQDWDIYGQYFRSPLPA